MLQHIGGVSFVLGLIMILAALSSIVLARSLPQSDFGQFSLMRTLILFIPPLTIWGQDLSTARFFSRHSPETYNWHAAFRKVWCVAMILSAAAVIAAFFIYDLNGFNVWMLAVACLFYTLILFVSNLVRSRQRYNRAILILNGFRGLFLPLLLLLGLFSVLNLYSVVTGYVGMLALVAVAGTLYALKSIPSGPTPVPGEYYRSGFILMGSQIAVTVMNSMDSLMIPYLLGYEALGLYAACLVPVRGFSILGRAGKYVWVPEFGRTASVRIKRISLAVGALSLLLLAAFVVFARPILHLLYSGKYDSGVGVLRILAAAGALKLIYTLSSSLIVGKLNNVALRWYTRVNMVSTLFYIGLLYVMVKAFSVTGAALALLSIGLLRLLAGYGLLYLFRGQLSGEEPAC
ncbi:MAG: oligosaccharide flippase family protein [candidate division KSB1 bacterium]|nr:oligosaccharide flippase family protein [candidate division KSB1 bacterium]